jgi:translocation and assembly module TamB
MRRVLLTACLLAAPAFGQEDDRDYLTAFLEDTLSDAGRQVTVTGFAGALSSRATIDQLTIADDQGIWLTLNGVVLDWSRSDLFAGQLNVSELSAAEIILARLPQTDDGLPATEASGFSLPELPVSISVDRVAAERIDLGPDVLGQAVTGRLEASLQLSGGEGQAMLGLLRTGEGPQGEITLDASYSNATRALVLDLVAEEEADGIAVNLLGVPGRPSASLRILGNGTIDDFVADVGLATEGAERLQGTVQVQAADPSGYRLVADLAGDLAPLLAPDQVAFFGNAVALKLDARRTEAGRTTVERFDLTARSLTLGGTAEIAADGLPEWFDVTGTLAAPDGASVTLPFAADTRLRRADFRLRTEPGGEGWSGEVSLLGLDRPDLTLAQAKLAGSGRIGRTAAGNSFGGTLTVAASGIAPTDPALAQAVGTEIAGSLRMFLQEGATALQLSDIRLEGAGLTSSGALRVEGLKDAFLTSGRLTLQADDFGRFSGLAGRPLGGSGVLVASGAASRLSGFFDLELAFEGTGLRLDVPQIDRLLAGRATLAASIRRDEGGTVLRKLDLAAGGLTAKADGTLASEGWNLAASVRLDDLSALGPGYGGALALEGSFSGLPKDGRLQLTGNGRSLRIGSAQADRLLAGESRLELDLAVKDSALQIRTARLANPQLSVTAKGEITGDTRRITLDARLGNLGLIVPELEGPLTFAGDATQDATGYAVDLTGSGPGQIRATVAGRIANGFGSADLAIRGSGLAGVANLFIAPRSASGDIGYDLRLQGPLSLASLTGRVTLSDGRIVDPNVGLSLQGVEAIGTLQGGSLQVQATSGLSSGGRLRVDGQIQLTGARTADLALTLDALRLYDPELYDTRASGNLTLRGPLSGGPLLSGTLSLAETEVRVPASGFSAAGALLDIAHVRDPAPVRETRRKAGLLGKASGKGSADQARPVALDITVSAPSQVFIRGRGIDAELGGELRLLGTSEDVRPAGGFQLIRGRLDILGRRLILSRADLALEGSLIPQISVAASTESDGITSTVTVEGPANDPVVRFTSSPELPQEEVLAQLLFGRGLDKISALQAAQLANAVAVLAGRGGVGLVGNLRRNFGLDDLDVTTSEDGSAALKAGKYISENVYTEIEIDQDGKSQINLNLDLREGVTVKGRVDADGETGIGVFLEKDY